MFSCEYCDFFRTNIFKEHLQWLLLANICKCSYNDLLSFYGRLWQMQAYDKFMLFKMRKRGIKFSKIQLFF